MCCLHAYHAGLMLAPLLTVQASVVHHTLNHDTANKTCSACTLNHLLRFDFTGCRAMNGCMQRMAEACIKRGCSSRNWSRPNTRRAHSKGRMAASFAGGRLVISSRPEAADKGPQAASRSLMVLLGDTPCSKSSCLPPACIYTQACAIVSDLLAANHMACCLHWCATIALTVFCVLLGREKVSEGLEKQSSG